MLGLAVGAEHLQTVLASESPFTAFITERGSTMIATLVTIGIIAALFNAIVSGVTCYGRFLYSTGRDRIWADGINRALVRLQPRWGSPWVATLAVAAFAAGYCVLPLDAIVPLISFATLATWVLLSAACPAGRRRGTTGRNGLYRAPLFPVPQIVSLLAVAGLTVLVRSDLEIEKLIELLSCDIAWTIPARYRALSPATIQDVRKRWGWMSAVTARRRNTVRLAGRRCEP